MTHFDAIIIGSGQGGTPLAKKLAEAGWKAALVEQKYIGGTCVNTGCTPTKTMIASAKVAYTLAEAGNYGVQAELLNIDMQAIIDRKNQVVKKFRNGSQSGLEETENLHLFFGTATFVGEKKLKLVLHDGSEQFITGKNIFIDTGSSPVIPEIEGLSEAGYFTADTLLDVPVVPGHLLVIGGGYIGLELGQMYRRFGSRVTVLEHHPQFLAREDADIAKAIRDFLSAEEIVVITDTTVQKVQKKNGSLHVTIREGDAGREITCTHILVSAGRSPYTSQLGLEAAGVALNDRGQVIVNEYLQTTAKDIYAIGDVKGGPEFTHISYNDYVILYKNLVEGKKENISNRQVPYTMFTDPQLGRVGLTEQEARKKGLNIAIASLPMSNVARAIETGDTRGMIKAIIDKDSGYILGVAVLGREGGEVMTILQMAMKGNITCQQISDMVFAHPLYAEALNNLFKNVQ